MYFFVREKRLNWLIGWLAFFIFHFSTPSMFAPLLLTSATLGLLLLILIISTCDSSMYPLHKMEALGCTYKRVAKDLQRDVVIGALFPVHHDIIKGRYTINVNSIAWVESFLFAIAQINNNTKLLPDISLGWVNYIFSVIMIPKPISSYYLFYISSLSEFLPFLTFPLTPHPPISPSPHLPIFLIFPYQELWTFHLHRTVVWFLTFIQNVFV